MSESERVEIAAGKRETRRDEQSVDSRIEEVRLIEQRRRKGMNRGKGDTSGVPSTEDDAVSPYQ